MSNPLFDDPDATYHLNREKWMKEQNGMRSRVCVHEDRFDWNVPTNVTIKFGQDQNSGSVVVHNGRTARRLRKRLNNDNNNNANDDHKTETQELRYIGGVDISPSKPYAFEYDKASAGLMIFEYPSMKLVHEETELVTLEHPYIAGFLAFREVNPLVKLIKKVKKTKPEFIPQVILVDGNGYLHYRRVGLATHLSFMCGIPTIGVAKRLLNVDKMNVEYLVPHLNQKLKKIGDFQALYGFNDDQLGYALRTCAHEQIVYVSPGHRISHQSALKIVMLTLDKNKRYQLPLPTEKADFLTRKEIRAYERLHTNPYGYNRYNDDYKQQQQMRSNRNNNNNARPYQSKRGNQRNQKNKRQNQKNNTLQSAANSNGNDGGNRRGNAANQNRKKKQAKTDGVRWKPRKSNNDQKNNNNSSGNKNNKKQRSDEAPMNDQQSVSNSARRRNRKKQKVQNVNHV